MGKEHAYNQSNICNDTSARLLYLDQIHAEFRDKKKKVPFPAAWGGYRLEPTSIEFFDAEVVWNRRVLWTREGDKWVRNELVS